MWQSVGANLVSLGLPGTESIKTKVEAKKTKDGRPDEELPSYWPKDAVLAQDPWTQLRSRAARPQNGVETQILHFDGEAWQAYTYRWNDDRDGR